MSRHFDSSTTTQNGLNHGPVWKTQSFLLSEICTVTLWQDYYGEGNLRRSYWSTVENSFKLWMFICQPSKKTILIRVCGRYQTGMQDRKTQNRLGQFSWKTLTWSFRENLMQKQYLLGPMTRKVTRRNVRKDIADEKNESVGGLVYSLLTNCSEMSVFGSYWETWYFAVCEQACACFNKMDKILWHMHRWPPLQRRRNEICWRIVTSMLSNFSEMLILGTKWDDQIFYGQWISFARSITEWTNVCDKTPESIDFIHSSHMWIQTVLLCG